jgi:hypothetical protein
MPNIRHIPKGKQSIDAASFRHSVATVVGQPSAKKHRQSVVFEVAKGLGNAVLLIASALTGIVLGVAVAVLTRQM